MANDQQKFERMMGEAEQRRVNREAYGDMSPQAMRHFSRPANQCELCGGPININPVDSKNRNPSPWEKKWSIHEECADQAKNRLDRESGVLSERRR